MHSELLPVHEGALLEDELEGGDAGGHAVVACALDGRGELELLDDVLVDVAALDALEGAEVELWLDFGGPGDGALEGSEAADLAGLEFSELDDVLEVEESELEGVLPASEVAVDFGDEFEHSLHYHWVVAAGEASLTPGSSK